jgi:hypothetical protein
MSYVFPPASPVALPVDGSNAQFLPCDVSIASHATTRLKRAKWASIGEFSVRVVRSREHQALQLFSQSGGI